MLYSQYTCGQATPALLLQSICDSIHCYYEWKSLVLPQVDYCEIFYECSSITHPQKCQQIQNSARTILNKNSLWGGLIPKWNSLRNLQRFTNNVNQGQAKDGNAWQDTLRVVGIEICRMAYSHRGTKYSWTEWLDWNEQSNSTVWSCILTTSATGRVTVGARYLLWQQSRRH